MGNDKYRLKWSKYEDNILDAFRSLLQTEALSDVTLFCEGATLISLQHAFEKACDQSF